MITTALGYIACRGSVPNAWNDQLKNFGGVRGVVMEQALKNGSS